MGTWNILIHVTKSCFAVFSAIAPTISAQLPPEWVCSYFLLLAVVHSSFWWCLILLLMLLMLQWSVKTTTGLGALIFSSVSCGVLLISVVSYLVTFEAYYGRIGVKIPYKY